MTVYDVKPLPRKTEMHYNRQTDRQIGLLPIPSEVSGTQMCVYDWCVGVRVMAMSSWPPHPHPHTPTPTPGNIHPSLSPHSTQAHHTLMI
mmetsp:Transcript_6235/g.15038  ORF Transcript_6235/g.15038 Transcript_6235/m.15038 type:complete len:90 (-) Transcript_6235:3-272(-)